MARLDRCLVEPVAANLTRAKVARSCPCLGYAVADQDGTGEFITVTEGFTQMSGLSGSYDENMLKRAPENPHHKETTIEVLTKSLNGISEEAGFEYPDFVSLDIEGSELSALQRFPFSDHRVGISAIQDNIGIREIVELMRGNDYELTDFCGPDEIYACRKN
ncbi:FkbM family methyltransferase [Yoonia sp.]|uniref:FkbM family methyltransferase n=1 Tax=Yoonia sp. TaxID=2212373 RepID=UPI00238DCE08|nr:FkbM family methyltransferase [Yoonia sp.]MDE0851289.1 FkbM family methyltransferase [Yoonia sp.]